MRNILKVFSVLLALVLLSSCGDESVRYTVYQKNADGDSLIPEKCALAPDATCDEVITALIGALASTPKTEGAVSALPSGTELLGVSIAGRTATVNLSDKYYENEGVDELLSRLAVVNTLCGIDSIDRVRIKVKDEPLVSATTGAEIGIINGSDVASGAQDTTVTDKQNVTLYFPDADGQFLVPESREIELQASISVERVIISELAKGPATDSLTQIIPSDINLISIETNDGVCFVNISGDSLSRVQSSSTSTTMALYSIVNSLTDVDGINSVQILIDGKTGVEFGNYVLDVPLERNSDLIKE